MTGNLLLTGKDSYMFLRKISDLHNGYVCLDKSCQQIELGGGGQTKSLDVKVTEDGRPVEALW